ncbi:hypothetical protein EYF80_065483 [Liparis tanakae]|uniref:Uncharacterized protein n=1 Tax=Liparis tanakae TaxID=230148 RepID=A0A4Z2E6W9_9TELE|nr:hypothetical protein EYF80_065483 [Liparis tanakae]
MEAAKHVHVAYYDDVTTELLAVGEVWLEPGEGGASKVERGLKKRRVERLRERRVERVKKRRVERVKKRRVERLRKRRVERLKKRRVERLKKRRVERLVGSTKLKRCGVDGSGAGCCFLWNGEAGGVS